MTCVVCCVYFTTHLLVEVVFKVICKLPGISCAFCCVGELVHCFVVVHCMSEWIYNIIAAPTADFMGLPRHGLGTLDDTFTEEKVHVVIFALPSEKAPSPDGYTARFFKRCCYLLKLFWPAMTSPKFCSYYPAAQRR